MWAALRLALLLGSGALKPDLAAAKQEVVKVSSSRLRAYRRAAPRCPETAEHCFGIWLHVVYTEMGPAQEPKWVRAQLQHANRLFASIGVGFEVAQVSVAPKGFARVVTRTDRDQLGKGDFTPHQIHVYLVEHLEDVDDPGNAIRGVHWRLRRDVSKRWIILSSIGSHVVLAHELGHYFGLPHSGYRVSIMNKKPREEPPWPKRRFADPEVARMRKRLSEYLETGMPVRRGALSTDSQKTGSPPPP